ncbi:type II toxin-antitoxin system RelE/ParE family toxin [Thiomicrospira sp. R3]|uniref:type II toxin-antitoxin system RelE/ParE family toxin n=1 Tax=Thiomicrospira sp. R3 TaxID=3035472 RepID=UPI00259B9A82|nr:type II toxin-antitoxin system RelE/ParE family toxin [Thiomicrospira sp. R3]WFE68101.1 type II toxin-antitoxin system RelE/ParE family toxin [Thiomicrospira sp. R3]
MRMKYNILTTSTFDKWLTKQKDRQAVKAIAMRIARAEQGNFGDCEPVGEGVSEMRIFIGKGYRIYFTIRGETLVLLLNGGIKSNKKQQQEDIAKAKQILLEIDL